MTDESDGTLSGEVVAHVDFTDREFPYSRPEGSDASMFLQWKGTDVCLDFDCRCGASGHLDGYFAYAVRCTSCGTIYQLGTQVIAKAVAEHDGKVLDLVMDEADEPEPEPYPCGHPEREGGCGGCDPGAIEYVRDDGGPWRRLGS